MCVIGVLYQPMAIFGGYRIWHGWAPENSQANSWDNHTTYPAGGYLDDLWIYTKQLDTTTTPGETLKTSSGRWRIMHANATCVSTPGLTWASREDVTCTRPWPQARAGHGSVWDDVNQRIWIFGGYNTYFPYLSTDGEGAGPGVSAGTGGFVPYPAFNYFLNDLWYYDLTLQNWTEIVIPSYSVDQQITDYNEGIYVSTVPVQPSPRADHIMLLVNNVIFVHGGYSDNTYFDDTWYFNISTGLWLQKIE